MSNGSIEAGHEPARQPGEPPTALGEHLDAGTQIGLKSWVARASARTDLRSLGVRIEGDQVTTLPGLLSPAILAR